MCELALAAALRRAGLYELAEAGERLAGELRARLEALGGRADPAVDDSWLMGTLADASHAALATYHDHLGDHDSGTFWLFRERAIPLHREALAHLRADVFRDSEL